MNKISKVIVLSSLVLALACGDDDTPTPTVDSSVVDTSMMMDSSTGNPPMPSLGTQIDRTGRPAINTALNTTFNPDKAMRDAAKNEYNQNADRSTWSKYAEGFETSLAILDSLDENCGNQLAAGAAEDNTRYDALASVLADDVLYVNISRGECGVYLGVEAEALTVVGAGDGKCGGRTLTDDVIERSYSVLALGELAGFDDTITSDGQSHSNDTFPFLAAPNAAN